MVLTADGCACVGEGHTINGAANAPRGANNCFIKVPRPAFGGNGMYFKGGSSAGGPSQPEGSKTFGEPSWAEVSMELTSSWSWTGEYGGTPVRLTAVETSSGVSLIMLASETWGFF